jgi:phage shock protein PspC (stress-responsive transcriptional regulator)
MFCNYCGKAIPDDARLCAYCGKTVSGVAMKRQLSRPRLGRKIAGVCLGFANYFDLDVTLVRVIWLLAVVFTIPFAIVGYIVAWVVMPEEPELLPEPAARTVINPQG